MQAREHAKEVYSPLRVSLPFMPATKTAERAGQLDFLWTASSRRRDDVSTHYSRLAQALTDTRVHDTECRLTRCSCTPSALRPPSHRIFENK